MDRIRKALDLARRDRASVAGLDRARIVGDDPAAIPAIHPKPAAALPASIVYTKTQVFFPLQESLESNRIINPSDRGAAAAAFRMLRTQILQRLDEKGWRTMAVMSPNAGDGKTTTAINLAVSLANDQRHTVLLVDCDLKQPAIARMLGMEPEFGLNDILTGAASVDQCLYHPDGFERLVVLTARAPLACSSEALSGPRARDVVSELRERYPERIVLFDLPPLLGADDALAFLPLVECGVIVVSEGETPREDLLRCMELTAKTPIVGTVLNRSSVVAGAYD
jgi:Mrp family chromosome partitioning ATPase